MKKICSDPECQNAVYRRGMCRRHWEKVRKQEREANQSIVDEAKRNTAWREYLPPCVYTPQDELDARALYCGNKERATFQKGRKLQGC